MPMLNICTMIERTTPLRIWIHVYGVIICNINGIALNQSELLPIQLRLDEVCNSVETAKFYIGYRYQCYIVRVQGI